MIENSMTEFLNIVDSWIGTPFLHANSCKGVGCDCLGLIRGVLLEFGKLPSNLKIPYYPKNYPFSAAQDLLTKEIAKYFPFYEDSNYNISDILVIRRGRFPTHLAWFVGNNQIVHSLPPHGVVKGTFDEFLRKRYIGRFKI